MPVCQYRSRLRLIGRFVDVVNPIGHIYFFLGGGLNTQTKFHLVVFLCQKIFRGVKLFQHSQGEGGGVNPNWDIVLVP